LATELIPYKGLSVFIAYTGVPLIQLFLSKIWTYQHILYLLLFFTFISLGLTCYFVFKVHYNKDNETGKITEKRKFQ